MKSIRLNSFNRRAVIEKIMANTFQRKEDALNRLEATIAEKLYVELWGGTKNLKLALRLPEGTFAERSWVTGTVDGASNAFKLPGEASRPVPNSAIGEVLFASGDKGIGDLLHEYRKRRDALKKERNALESKVRSIVFSVNTTKQLFAIWQEAVEFFDNPDTLPVSKEMAVKIDDLNASIKKAKDS